MKKLFAAFLVLVLSLSMLLPVGAFAEQESTEALLRVAGELYTKEELITELEIEKEDLFITEEVAGYIAQFFLEDTMTLDDVIWDSSTAIVNTIPMYDESGSDAITAYTFELTTGYIVVAAYSDMPNIITEWSDVTEPVYEALNLNAAHQVVYMGGLQYYIDDGATELKTLEGLAVSRDEVYNVMEAVSSFEYVPDAVLIDVAQEKLFADSETPMVRAAAVITDPYVHAKNTYGGTFSYVESTNKWESYIKYLVMSSFNTVDGINFYNHCGPTAYANMVVAYGYRYNISAIKNTAYAQVFKKCALLSPNYVNSSGSMGGSLNILTNANIIASFNAFGVDKSSSVKGRYSITYANVKSALNNNSLLLVMLMGHDTYSDHQILCHAYTRMVSDTNASAFKTYLKVADGWGSSGRYVDLASTGDQYWEVKF